MPSTAGIGSRRNSHNGVKPDLGIVTMHPLPENEKALSPQYQLLRVAGGLIAVNWQKTQFYAIPARTLTDECALAEMLDHLPGNGGNHSPLTAQHVKRWMVGIYSMVRTVGYGRALRFLPTAASPYNRRECPPHEFVLLLKELVEKGAAQSWLIADDCKVEALTAFVILRRRGYDATISVGMREYPFSLHTWTTSGGIEIPARAPHGYEFHPILQIRG